MILLVAAVVLEMTRNGIGLVLESDTQTIDPGRSVFVTLTLTVPRDVNVALPDFRDRVRGFSLAEDFEEDPQTKPDGGTVRKVNWKLVPEPCAEEYKIAPFVVSASPRLLSSQADDGSLSFWAGPVRFEAPPPREPVTGGIETDPRKDLPPLSWKLVGLIAATLSGLAALIFGIWWTVRLLARKVREHRMSPIERAWVELDRLLRKGLPGRGRYKDFYVELTMVVRRYVQRQHGVVAPHLTTEEFFAATRNAPSFPKSTLDELIDFLRKADMIKFAGVVATPETADEATDSARAYMTKDADVVRRRSAREASK